MLFCITIAFGFVLVSIVSFLLVFVLNTPKQREHTFRPCIWTHGTLTPVWFSHRCPHWLRRLTFCYASTLDLWLDISIIIPFACYRPRHGLRRSVRVLKTSNCLFGCSLLWLVLSDSKRKVKGTLIFSCQGTMGLADIASHFLCRFGEGVAHQTFNFYLLPHLYKSRFFHNSTRSN